MARLEGKVALITGAASGIGAACAARFAEEGAAVAGLDVQKPVDAAAWAAVEDRTSASFRDGLDVRIETEVAEAVAEAKQRFGRIDILVNAAGVGGFSTADQCTEEEWDRTVDINLKGSWLVSKHVLPAMIEQQSGSVIHLASVEGIEGMGGSLAYNASKGGVVLMTKNMAIDYGKLGIRVNCLCPGLIDTPLTELLQSEELSAIRRKMLDWHALGRAGRPEEVAACALFLASDEASFVTDTPWSWTAAGLRDGRQPADA